MLPSCRNTLSDFDVTENSENFSYCLVAPHILEITIREGKIIYGSQTEYLPQPGDVIRESGVNRMVYNAAGEYRGCLVGKNQDILQTLDKCLAVDFPIHLAGDPENYRLASRRDRNYAGGVSPVKVYRKSKPADLARIDVWHVDTPSVHVLYLVFASPLTYEADYTLSAKKILDQEIRFIYLPKKMRSEAVHISQIGFAPDDPVKIGFLSTWLGDGGPVQYPQDMTFQIIAQETDEVVFRGILNLSKAADDVTEDGYQRNYSGTDVYQMDFSSLNKPGRYRLYVEGIGCSFPFVIEEDVWEKAFVISARGFYHQRSGIELGPPYTTFIRPRCFHPDDGVVVYQSRTPLMETSGGLNSKDTNFQNLVNGLTNEVVHNAWGGYMDAGDWDRRIQHLEVSRLLLELAELFPEYYGGVSLNIPESGNSLPDIIDEALFNLDFYMRLQTESGGIRGGIESSEHPRIGEASWQESLTVIAYAPGVWSSYIYAGVTAQAAFVLKDELPQLSMTYQESAEKAMLWAEKGRDTGIDSSYENAVRDVRNLAAAELFRLTGQDRWHEIFLATTAFKKSGIDLFVWQQHEQRHAAWCYVRTQNAKASKEIQQFCFDAIIREADERLASIARSGFHYAKYMWQPALWGAFTAPDAVTLIRAHVLTKKEKYLKGIILSCQTGAGANPLNISYTTGVGQRWPQHVLHVDAWISHQEAPYGITIAGPMDYPLQIEGDTRWFLDIVKPYIYPPPEAWPALESYWDVFWFPAQCEFTVFDPMAKNAYVWGYLAAVTR